MKVIHSLTFFGLFSSSYTTFATTNSSNGKDTDVFLEKLRFKCDRLENAVICKSAIDSVQKKMVQTTESNRTRHECQGSDNMEVCHSIAAIRESFHKECFEEIHSKVV